MNEQSNQTILLDIYTRLGRIEQQLEGLSKLEDSVAELKEFKSRIGAYIWMGGLFVSGMFTLLWAGVKYATDKWFH